MTYNAKVRLLQVVNHVAAIVGCAFAIWHGYWGWFVVGLAVFFIFGIFGANIGMHRLISHRSFSTSPANEFILSILATLTTMGSTLAWVGLHRFHHSCSDQAVDPHSPHTLGNFNAWVGRWRQTLIEPRYIHDLLHSRLHRNLHKHYFKIIFVYAGVLFLVDPLATVFMYCLPASLCLQGSSAVTVLCHRWGYRRFETADHSYNNWLAWILSLGEGWHNNHHRNPSALRQGIGRYEFDPSAWIIESYLAKSPAPKRRPVYET